MAKSFDGGKEFTEKTRVRSRGSAAGGTHIARIFMLVGIVMLVVGAYWLVSSVNFVKRAETVQAEITEIIPYRDSDGDIHHKVYVRYEYGGQEYSRTLSEYSSSMYEGKMIELYIDPQNPAEIRYSGMAYFGAALFLGMGLIFSIVGFVCARAFKKNGRSGGADGEIPPDMGSAEICVYAEVIDCAQDNTYGDDGKRPCRLYCRYTDEQMREHFYTSDPIWAEDAEYLRRRAVGRFVPVYVKDDEDYRINLEALFKEN